MTIATPAEIAKFRSEFAAYPKAIEALDAIEDCEGDLEDAAMVLAIRVGQEPQIRNSEWLDTLARKYRSIICRTELRNDLLSENYGAVMEYLIANKLCPPLLITPVLIYVVRAGIDDFCKPFDPIS